MFTSSRLLLDSLFTACLLLEALHTYTRTSIEVMILYHSLSFLTDLINCTTLLFGSYYDGLRRSRMTRERSLCQNKCHTYVDRL